MSFFLFCNTVSFFLAIIVCTCAIALLLSLTVRFHITVDLLVAVANMKWP